MEILQRLSDVFWNEKLWLPANITWNDMDRNLDKTGIYIPTFSDLWIPLPIAFVICFVRLLWEFIAKYIGRMYDLKETSPRRPVYNKHLEAEFKKSSKQPLHPIVTELSKKVDMTPRQIERWWRRRRIAGQPSEMRKFQETSWRFMFYLVAFWYGLYIMWDQPWFWNPIECWIDYPKIHLDDKMWYYYMVTLGFYWALVFSIFSDQKRKDFYEQLVHHGTTIILLGLSWSINTVRTGAMVLCVHDAADYWMESAKLAKYLKYPRLCDTLFVIFTIVWFMTRTGLFPFHVLYSAIIDSFDKIGYIFFICLALLLVLQFLHIIWSVKILTMVYSYIIRGEVEKDGRSETEPSCTSEDEKQPKRPENNNTKFGVKDKRPSDSGDTRIRNVVKNNVRVEHGQNGHTKF